MKKLMVTLKSTVLTALAFAVVSLSVAQPARAGSLELIPSVGMSKGTDTNAAKAEFYGSVALRAAVLPMLKVEGGIAYRTESLSAADNITLRVWPVTVSAWLTPIPMVYFGGGLGWYRETIDYATALQFPDVTTDRFGEHIGGGILIPITPKLGFDFNGRYVFMQPDNDLRLLTKFNPDFWSLSAGLAIGF